MHAIAPLPDNGPHRAVLLRELETAGRALSATAVMFHTALSAHLGLSATEEKALDLLDRHGPLTAKQLAEHSGLAPATITGLAERLERKGFASRRRDPDDGRRVVIETSPDRLAPLAQLFADWAERLAELYSGYSDAELEVILAFMQRATELQREATAKLTREE
jgi:DNA-binding MarR family transcriptional regulator